MLDLPPCVEPGVRHALVDAMIDAGAAAIRHATNPNPHLTMPLVPPLPDPLDLVLTMVAGPGDNLVLALVDRQTGRPVPAIEISTHNGADDGQGGPIAGQTLVTVTLLADLARPGSVPAAA
ncbi:MAG TPA: hypothetical protein PLX97_07930 [Gemmatales bacterium]|nr:hypothetical protein [Gemmatales bacterium]